MNISMIRPISSLWPLLFVCGCFVCGCRARQLEVKTNGFKNAFTISGSTNDCWLVSYDSESPDSCYQRNTGASIFGKTSAELVATNLLVVTSSDIGSFAVGPSGKGGLFQVSCVRFDAGTNLYWILQSNVNPDGVLYESATIIKNENGLFLDPVELRGLFSKWDAPNILIDKLTHEMRGDHQK